MVRKMLKKMLKPGFIIIGGVNKVVAGLMKTLKS